MALRLIPTALDGDPSSAARDIGRGPRSLRGSAANGIGQSSMPPVLYLRGNRLSHKVWDSHDAILDDCSTAWNDLAASPELIRSNANRGWTSVNV
jgi:hypothetical protein